MVASQDHERPQSERRPANVKYYVLGACAVVFTTWSGSWSPPGDSTG